MDRYQGHMKKEQRDSGGDSYQPLRNWVPILSLNKQVPLLFGPKGYLVHQTPIGDYGPAYGRNGFICK